MHTENEAKDLWCPLVRHEGDGGTFNRGWAPHNPLNAATAASQAAFVCNCIASRCAAWRWGEPLNVPTVPCADSLARTEPARPPGMPNTWSFIPSLFGVTPAHWTAPEDARPRHGYCGLFTPPLIR